MAFVLLIHILLWCFWTVQAEQGCSATEGISTAIRNNDFIKARFLALQALQSGSCREEQLARVYQHEADSMLANRGGDTVPTLTRTHMVHARDDEVGCWNFDPDQGDQVEWWDECCSQATSPKDTSGDLLGSSFQDSSEKQCYRGVHRMCCDFYQGSSSYLRLPVLRELSLRLQVDTDDDSRRTYNVQQDGFLRRFDPAGILWPTGYFLTLCVSAPNLCGVPELYKAAELYSSSSRTNVMALELGAGLGLPSIALTETLSCRVVATDKAPHALQLMEDNRVINAPKTTTVVTSAHLDHYNMSGVTEFRQMQDSGFAIILGSALQALFDESTRDKDHHLWKVLDTLLEHSDTSIVLLAHTIHSLEVPENGEFIRLRTISGRKFGMKTRWGDASDFEISLFRRRAPAVKEHATYEEL